MPPSDHATSIGIVDPDPSTRVALARLLFAHGYQATAFVSIAEYAGHTAFARPVDVLFVDVRDYLQDRSQQLARLLERTIVIALANEVRVDLVGRALAAGCVEYLVRPLRTDLLRQVLDQAAAQLAAR